MKKFLIIIMILTILSSLAFAKLSDETLEEIEDLRFKYYGYRNGELSFYADFVKGDWLVSSEITWTHDFLSIKVEGNKLIIETQDGKWFIEMTKVK